MPTLSEPTHPLRPDAQNAKAAPEVGSLEKNWTYGRRSKATHGTHAGRSSCVLIDLVLTLALGVMGCARRWGWWSAGDGGNGGDGGHGGAAGDSGATLATR